MARADKREMWELENYFREQLLRELSQMFKWEGLPDSIPEDYLERSLVRYGHALLYYDDEIGYDILRCTVTGYNRHNMATHAQTWTPNTENQKFQITRKIKRLTDGKNAVENFNIEEDGVLFSNMEYNQNMQYIVDFYAKRLAKAQKAFDNSLVWSNIPYIFLADGDDMVLSIKKMFEAAQEGKPFIISDKALYTENKDRAGVPTSIPFAGKEIFDIINEIKMDFRQTVGFDTAGVDKAERVNTLEIKSNDQHTYTVLQIMLKQRQIAAENANAFMGLSLSVDIAGKEEIEVYEEGELDNGTDISGTEESTQN